MAYRLHEVHPSLVHYPLTLLPISVGADLVGTLTGSDKLKEIGRLSMAAGAVSALFAGLAGLVAQEEVDLDNEEAHGMLTSHRNLNLGLMAGSALMAWQRSRSEPGPGYLAAGVGSIAGLMWSAYLGGKLVYKHGAGVERAGGVLEGESPEFRRGQTADLFRKTGRHLKVGSSHTVEHLKEGEIAPVMRERRGGSKTNGQRPSP
ncbi:DUF2231 domain-containing protein [Persicimonas caeni]|uniref:DUF2231 domain-containing protein n=1 Tax=Persicimonas caeni TaxID=2292766 RepID=A0A4Y6PYW2_PERCE|nr:DUF2231 domain-containing protein [Persicimonas caeni]QDG53516.1 DUF2231 domain-containing protein [Persicimonas caeni]QED34737.1 DUF2231 domain-containing protein [Persicimonas caeni]